MLVKYNGESKEFNNNVNMFEIAKDFLIHLLRNQLVQKLMVKMWICLMC